MNRVTMSDGTHSIQVMYDDHLTTEDIADLLEFKSRHIKAHADPVIFKEAAERLRELEKTIQDVCCGGVS